MPTLSRRTRRWAAPVALCLALPLILAGCPPRTVTPTPGGTSIPAGAPTALPDRVVGRSTAPGPVPCTTAIGLVNQTLTTPAMELTGSPTRPQRSRIQSGSGTYAYAVAPVNPVTCQIVPVAVPLATTTFAFTYIRDMNFDADCVEDSILTINQFEPPLSNVLIREPFKTALWSSLESNPLLAGTGRCSNWIEMPPPFWP